MRVRYVLSVALFMVSAHATARTINRNLKEQVQGTDYRVLPCTGLFCLAVDGHLFYRMSDSFPGFYHGGYWVNSFLEVTPNEKLALNAKVVAYNPAASYGVASDSRLHPFVGVSWTDNLSNYGAFDLGIRGQFFDLDRQTLGAGLTLQDKEMSGLLIELQRGKGRFKWIFDGTGGYHVTDDLFYYSLDFWNNLVGISAITYHNGDKPFLSLFSMHSFSPGLSHLAEISTRNSAAATLIGIEYQSMINSWLNLGAKYENRFYGAGYATRIKKAIQHDYVSIEQDDKAFTDSMNIFSVDDDVIANAIHVDLRIKFSSLIFAYSENEVAHFNYGSTKDETFYFHRHGVGICPRRIPTECGYFFYSNKMIAAASHISQNDVDNKRLFSERPFVGMEAKFAF